MYQCNTNRSGGIKTVISNGFNRREFPEFRINPNSWSVLMKNSKFISKLEL